MRSNTPSLVVANARGTHEGWRIYWSSRDGVSHRRSLANGLARVFMMGFVRACAVVGGAQCSWERGARFVSIRGLSLRASQIRSISRPLFIDFCVAAPRNVAATRNTPMAKRTPYLYESYCSTTLYVRPERHRLHRSSCTRSRRPHRPSPPNSPPCPSAIPSAPSLSRPATQPSPPASHTRIHERPSRCPPRHRSQTRLSLPARTARIASQRLPSTTVRRSSIHRFVSPPPFVSSRPGHTLPSQAAASGVNAQPAISASATRATGSWYQLLADWHQVRGGATRRASTSESCVCTVQREPCLLARSCVCESSLVQACSKEQAILQAREHLAQNENKRVVF